jgi:hypothetical protein
MQEREAFRKVVTSALPPSYTVIMVAPPTEATLVGDRHALLFALPQGDFSFAAWKVENLASLVDAPDAWLREFVAASLALK